jgi:hypothetical protein
MSIALAAFLLGQAPEAAAATAPVASFSVSPPTPRTLETVTFRSTSSGSITSHRWDLDNDGSCDDVAGPDARRSFPVSGSYRITLCVAGPGGTAEQTQNVVVANRGPLASLVALPRRPETGASVSFVSTSRDPDGPIVSQAWDLDGDGAFDDGGDVTASRTFSLPGRYTIGLRVADRNGAKATAIQVVSVRPALLAPFPVVLTLGEVLPSGLRIKVLQVEAPRGARVRIRCRGRGCPRRRSRRRPPRSSGPLAIPARSRRYRRFERWLRAPATLEIVVTKPGRIGKYTRLRVRRGKRPLRKDLCIFPGKRRPQRCPSE